MPEQDETMPSCPLQEHHSALLSEKVVRMDAIFKFHGNRFFFLFELLLRLPTRGAFLPMPDSLQITCEPREDGALPAACVPYTVHLYQSICMLKCRLH